MADDLLQGFSDVDGDALSVANLTSDNGIFTAIAGGWTFTPDANYNGTVALDYDVTDGAADVTSTQSFSLTAVNDMPVPMSDVKDVNEDASIVLSFADLLANDTDVDGNSPIISAINTSGLKGHAVLDRIAKTITYTANADEFDLLATGNLSSDSFSYTMQSSNGSTTANATITLNVKGVTDGRVMIGTNKKDVLNGSAPGIGDGDDTINGGNGEDSINGGNGADRLYGDNGNDNLLGGNSIDYLYGGNGDDKLEGGAGNDWLSGEKGNDILTGGTGADHFLFAKSSGEDKILDFKIAEGDVIQSASDTAITDWKQLLKHIKIDGEDNSEGEDHSHSGQLSSVQIDLGEEGQVVLVGVTLSDLTASQFVFS